MKFFEKYPHDIKILPDSKTSMSILHCKIMPPRVTQNKLLKNIWLSMIGNFSTTFMTASKLLNHMTEKNVKDCLTKYIIMTSSSEKHPV